MNSISYLCGRLLAVFFAASAVSTAIAGQPNYAAMYVFGDSLSDTGNDFAATTAQQMVPAAPPPS